MKHKFSYLNFVPSFKGNYPKSVDNFGILIQDVLNFESQSRCQRTE